MTRSTSSAAYAAAAAKGRLDGPALARGITQLLPGGTPVAVGPNDLVQGIASAAEGRRARPRRRDHTPRFRPDAPGTPRSMPSFCARPTIPGRSGSTRRTRRSRPDRRAASTTWTQRPSLRDDAPIMPARTGRVTHTARADEGCTAVFTGKTSSVAFALPIGASSSSAGIWLRSSPLTTPPCRAATDASASRPRRSRIEDLGEQERDAHRHAPPRRRCSAGARAGRRRGARRRDAHYRRAKRGPRAAAKDSFRRRLS